MESAESLITQFKLHLQSYGSKITYQQLAVIGFNKRDILPYIRIHV